MASHDISYGRARGVEEPTFGDPSTIIAWMTFVV